MSGGKRAPSSFVKKATASRPARDDAGAVERLDHLEAGQHPEVAVEAAAGSHGVDVRTDHHGREARIAPGPGGDDVADGVDPHVETEIDHPGDHEVTAAPVVVGEGEPGRAAAAVDTLDRPDLGQRLEPIGQARDVDSQSVPLERRHRPRSWPRALQPVNRSEQNVRVQVRAEFTIEPFREAAPGPHVAAAVEAAEQSGLDARARPVRHVDRRRRGRRRRRARAGRRGGHGRRRHARVVHRLGPRR